MTDPRTGPDEPAEQPTEPLRMTAPAGGPEPDEHPAPEDRPEPEDIPAFEDGTGFEDGTEPDDRPAAASGPVGAAPAVARGRRRTRISTVVLGLVLAAVAATVWVDRVLERHVSIGGVATGVMIAAGALLLGGAVLRPDPRSR